jgi:hypothetical protein
MCAWGFDLCHKYILYLYLYCICALHFDEFSPRGQRAHTTRVLIARTCSLRARDALPCLTAWTPLSVPWWATLMTRRYRRQLQMRARARTRAPWTGS